MAVKTIRRPSQPSDPDAKFPLLKDLEQWNVLGKGGLRPSAYYDRLAAERKARLAASISMGSHQTYEPVFKERKYDEIKKEADHYTRYLARLMLNLRRASATQFRGAVSPGSSGRNSSHIYDMYTASQARARNRLSPWSFRKETGELVYNPLFQIYAERKTWFTPRRHWWNYRDSFNQQLISREFREKQARTDFYISQLRRLGPLLDLIQTPRSQPKLDKPPCGTWEYVWSTKKRTLIPHWRPCERPQLGRYKRQTRSQYGRRQRSPYHRRNDWVQYDYRGRRPYRRYRY